MVKAQILLKGGHAMIAQFDGEGELDALVDHWDRWKKSMWSVELFGGSNWAFANIDVGQIVAILTE